MTDLAELHAFALTLAEASCGRISASRPVASDNATKHDAADWVTPVDRAVESETRSRIAARFPGHAIVGEEFGGTATPANAAITWHLDPIDGTMNFVHGIPWVAFSLAARDERGLAIGVVADVYRGDVYSALRGGGAWLNGRRVQCGAYGDPAGGVFLTEWSRQSAWPGMDRYLARVSAAPAATRIMGSCALALALVGAGRATGVVLPGIYNSWDVYAGGLIAREGGAQLFGRDGTVEDVPLDGVLAAPAGVARWLWQAWTGRD